MSPLLKFTLQRRLTLISMLTSVFTLVLACAAFLGYEQIAFKLETARNLDTTAQMIGFNCTAALAFNDPSSAKETLKGLTAQPHIIRACIYDLQGKVFAGFRRANSPSDPWPLDLPTGTTYNPNAVDVVQPISSAGDTIGVIFLESDLAEMRSRWHRYGLISLGVLIAATLIAWLIASQLQGIISDPLIALAAVTDHVAKQRDYSVRAVKTSTDEIGRLIDGFNEMLNQIQYRDTELQGARIELESRVKSRTSELRQEITERKAVENSLRLFSSAVEQSGESIIITDAQLDEPGPRIVFLNPAFTRMTGYAANEALGKTPRILQGSLTDRSVLDRLRRNLEAGEVFEGETTNYRKDGTSFSLSWQIAPIRDDQGAITHFVAIQRDTSERKRQEVERDLTHRQLLESSRMAGMAEVATGVLHNVGNVLNSVNVSATIIDEQIRHSKALNIAKLDLLLREHQDDIGTFMTSDPKGKLIPGYIATLAEQIALETGATASELDNLRKNIEHIKDIVAMQQNYAKTSGVVETVAVSDLVEDALRMNLGSLQRHGVIVVRDFEVQPVVTVDKHKVLQVLVNLIRNAKYACDESNQIDKKITLKITADNQRARIAVIDNGVGIPAENLTRIFAHGFTTRKEGHGFGLHNGALSAKELGGSLTVRSQGPGKGATFTLEIPYNPEARDEYANS